uniref:Anthranilate synthase n=1 Tax=Strobilurus tenacellus TaxID=41251 RepID=A0A384XG68_STRTC|nr:anthranilate synthase [Strobilurus tenacellus]
MQDGEGNSLGSAPALVATTLLTAVVGVGAVLYNRSSVKVNTRVGEMLGALGLTASGSDVAPAQEETMIVVEAEVEDKAKAPRSKERRRRGKDPLKEVLKGSKKAKARLEKVLAATGTKDGGSDHYSQRGTEPESRSEYATTSRSVSTSSSRRHVSSSVSSCNGDADEDEDELTPAAGDSVSVSSSIPSLVDSVSTTSASSVATLPSDSESEEPRAVVAALESHFDLQDMTASLEAAIPSYQERKSQPTAGPSSNRRRNGAPRFPSPSRVALGIPPSQSTSPRLSYLSRTPSTLSSSAQSSRPSTPPHQTQIASLRGALEAARTREETARRDIERYGKELEVMRWERDALRAQVSQMQAYLGALLSSPPPFTPYALTPGSPGAGMAGVNGWYPPLHMQVPYSGSAVASPGGSPASRGRRRTRPDLRGFDEEEPESEVNEVLADAILKRPGSMLGPRSTAPSPSLDSSGYFTGDRSTGHSPAPPIHELEEPREEVLEELTFPSLYPVPPPTC